MLGQISRKLLDPKDLTAHQKRICTRFLLQDRKHTQHEIASILKVDDSWVSRAKIRIQNEGAWVLDFIDERRIATEIIQTADVATARLFRAGKDKEAWTVRKEAVEVLQTLGYVKKKPVEVDLKGLRTLQEILQLAHGSGIESIPRRAGQGGSSDKDGPLALPA